MLIGADYEKSALHHPVAEASVDNLRAALAEAYSVMGFLAERAGLLHSHPVLKALDNTALAADGFAPPHRDVLESIQQDSGKVAA